MRTGNGQPGGPFGGGDAIEQAVHRMSVTLHQRLRALGIPHVCDDYGPGGHTWPYWQRDLRETLPRLMRTFAHPPAPAVPLTFRAIEPRLRRLRLARGDRPARARVQPTGGARRGGFALRGSGTRP